MPENCLSITYSNPNGVFCPGADVKGIVHLDLEENIKAKSLRITVDGRAYTHWSATNSFKIRSTRIETYSVTYSATVIYVTGDTLAWAQPQGKEVLRSGSYSFPFVFKLPPNCAPSFEGIYGHIRYMVKAELDRPLRFNKCVQKPFTVVSIFDLNANPKARLPLSIVNTVFQGGNVTVQCEMAKSGFVPGETIVVNATIDNDSTNTITKAHVTLVEYSRYEAYEHGKIVRQGILIDARGRNYRELRRKIATLSNQKLYIDKKSNSIAQIYLQVPPTVPSFKMCPILSVKYYLKIKFEINGIESNSNIESVCPIVVGTVPVQAQTAVVTQPTAPPFMEFPSSSDVSPTVPSAPPMESPPSYMNTNGNMAFLPPPPSYEECIQGVQGTTIDTENFEVELERNSVGSLGVQIASVSGRVCIKQLTSEPAASHPDIHVGDTLVYVNGEPVANKSHQEVVSMLRSGGNIVTLGLRREPQKKGNIITAVLEKKPEGSLGLSLAKRIGFEGIFIQMIAANSAAAVEGSLRVGDRLVLLDGESVTDLTPTAILERLRAIQGAVHVTVSRDPQ